MDHAAHMDFEAEGRRLRAALGLDTATPGANHHDMDKLWVDKKTGGAVWVGNETAAKMSLQHFAHYNISGVVNCTDDMPHFSANAPGGPSYMRFNIAWHTHVSGSPAKLSQFLGGFFAFMDAALSKGESVLLHCLAGAHRAGTAGVLVLMHKDGLDVEDAIRAAQALRPIINPIGQLPLLLRRYAALREAEHRQVWAEAEDARRAQASRLAASSKRATSRADLEEEEEAEEAPSLDDCINALNFIGRKADTLYAYAHAVRVELQDYGGDEDADWDGEDADEYEYDDDFDEFDIEDEDEDEDPELAPGTAVAGRVFSARKQQPQDEGEGGQPQSARSYEADLDALRKAVEDSREAVRSVEARLTAAEADEPLRDAAVAASRSPFALLAASISSALGVSKADAEGALARSAGNLDKAVSELAQLATLR